MAKPQEKSQKKVEEKSQKKVEEKPQKKGEDKSKNKKKEEEERKKKEEEEMEEEEEEEEKDDDEEEEEEEDDEEEEKPQIGQKRKHAGDEEEAPSKAQATASAKVFVGSLAYSVTNDILLNAFKKFGKIVSADVLMNDDGRSRGIGFVNFERSEDAEKAASVMNGKEIEGRTIKAEISQTRERKSGGNIPTATLFAGNLSFRTTKDSLTAAFESFNGMKDARVAIEKESGKSKGFGYIDFETVEQAKTAFEAMNGEDVDGRPVRLDFANSDGPRGGSGGFDGGRGRGGFDGGRGGRGGFRGGRGGFDGGRGGRGGFRGGRGGFDGGRGGRGGFRGGRGGFSGGQGKRTSFDD